MRKGYSLEKGFLFLKDWAAAMRTLNEKDFHELFWALYDYQESRGEEDVTESLQNPLLRVVASLILPQLNHRLAGAARREDAETDSPINSLTEPLTASQSESLTEQLTGSQSESVILSPIEKGSESFFGRSQACEVPKETVETEEIYIIQSNDRLGTYLSKVKLSKAELREAERRERVPACEEVPSDGADAVLFSAPIEAVEEAPARMPGARLSEAEKQSLRSHGVEDAYFVPREKRAFVYASQKGRSPTDVLRSWWYRDRVALGFPPSNASNVSVPAVASAASSVGAPSAAARSSSWNFSAHSFHPDDFADAALRKPFALTRA